MKSKLTITVKKRTQPEFLISLIIMLPFAFGILFDLLSFPSFFKYILDISWILLLVLILKNTKSLSFSGPNRVLSIFVLLFLLATLIIYPFTFQSPMYYLWGVRNNFRFYVFFFACISFLKKDSIDGYLSIFDVLFWINAVVCTVQFFAFQLSGDFLGGIFGTEKGCNAYTNILFTIVLIKSIIYYLHKLESIWTFIAKMITMMIVSSWAEIKFFYVELIIIIITAILFTSFSWRKLAIALVGIIGVGIGLFVLSIVFPASAEVLSFSGLLDLATSENGYTSDGDLNRLTTIPIISETFLTTTPNRLFGLGLGNCDTAAYSFLQTPFYLKYSYLNYSWFSTAFIFLELGYTGLFFFFGFFVLIFFLSRKASTKSGGNKMYCQIASILAICCALIAIYNSSLRTEAGYMVYFVLALPFVSGTKRQGELVASSAQNTRDGKCVEKNARGRSITTDSTEDNS
jgi:hypothetical protein